MAKPLLEDDLWRMMENGVAPGDFHRVPRAAPASPLRKSGSRSPGGAVVPARLFATLFATPAFQRLLRTLPEVTDDPCCRFEPRPRAVTGDAGRTTASFRPAPLRPLRVSAQPGGRHRDYPVGHRAGTAAAVIEATVPGAAVPGAAGRWLGPMAGIVAGVVCARGAWKLTAPDPAGRVETASRVMQWTVRLALSAWVAKHLLQAVLIAAPADVHWLKWVLLVALGGGTVGGRGTVCTAPTPWGYGAAHSEPDVGAPRRFR